MSVGFRLVAVGEIEVFFLGGNSTAWEALGVRSSLVLERRSVPDGGGRDVAKSATGMSVKIDGTTIKKRTAGCRTL